MKTAVLHINKSNLYSSAFCGFAELFASAKVIYIISTKAAFNKHSFLCNKFKFNGSRFGGLRELFTSFFNFHNNFIVSRPPKPQLSSYTPYLRKMHGFGGFFDDYYFLFICSSRNALTHTSSDTDLRRSLRVSGGFSAINKQQYNSGKPCGNKHGNGSAKPAAYSGNGVPEISTFCHPQGWSRSELWETQSGSTPDRRSPAKNLVSRPTDSTISKYETAVGYDSNGVLSDMLSTDAQHLAFQKFGRTAGFDSLPLLNLCGRRKPHSDAFKTKAWMTAGKDRHFLKKHFVQSRHGTIQP